MLFTTNDQSTWLPLLVQVRPHFSLLSYHLRGFLCCTTPSRVFLLACLFGCLLVRVLTMLLDHLHDARSEQTWLPRCKYVPSLSFLWFLLIACLVHVVCSFDCLC